MAGSRSNDVTLKIPRPLYDDCARSSRGTGFHSVTEFCVYVLRDLAAAHGPAEDDALSHEEVAAIRRRRSLSATWRTEGSRS